MKHMLRLSILAAAIMVALPVSARAADADGDSGFGIYPYIGLTMGVYDLKFSTVGFSNQSNNVFGGAVRLGADFNDYLGAELRVSGSDKGRVSSPGVGAATQQIRYLFSYLGKLQFPATQELSIYGLVGGTTGNISIHGPTPGSQLGGRVATGLSFGGGLDYKVDDFFHVGLEYMSYWHGVKINKASVWPNDTKANVAGYTATIRIDM